MMARPGMTRSYKSGSVFGKTPLSTTPVPTKPAAVDDSSDLVGGELKGGEEGVDIFPSSDPILGSSSTDIITVDDEEETPKQKIIPPRSTDLRLRPNWKEENRKKEEEGCFGRTGSFQREVDQKEGGGLDQEKDPC